jgi:hypothetical protein
MKESKRKMGQVCSCLFCHKNFFLEHSGQYYCSYNCAQKKTSKEPKDTDLIQFEKLVFYTGLSSRFWLARLNSAWCPPFKKKEEKSFRGKRGNGVQFLWGDVKKWLDREMRIKGINK